MPGRNGVSDTSSNKSKCSTNHEQKRRDDECWTPRKGLWPAFGIKREPAVSALEVPNGRGRCTQHEGSRNDGDGSTVREHCAGMTV